MTALDKVKEFMTIESVFVLFLHLVSCIVYSSPLDLVEAEVKNENEMTKISKRWFISSGIPPVKFIINWDIAGFLKRELADSKPGTAFGRFLSLLIISGSVKSCYATNIETYLKWRWPVTSGYLLDSLRACIETVLGGKAVLSASGGSLHDYVGELISRYQGRTLIVNVRSNKGYILEIV